MYIISREYTRCDFYRIVSAAMNCLPSKKSACVDDIFIVPSKSAWQLLGREREIMVWSSHNKIFIFRSIRFISLILLSTSVALNTLSLHQLFPDFGNIFASPYVGASNFWRPLVVLVIFPRYDHAMEACKRTYFHSTLSPYGF